MAKAKHQERWAMNKRAVTVSGYVIFVSLFAKWKINTFSGLYIFRVSTMLPPWWRKGRGTAGLSGGVACSPVITVPSHFPSHWWIFQSWCDCPSWQRWCSRSPPPPLSLFKATLQPPPHSASTHPGSVWSFWIAANRWRHCGVSWRKKKKKMH